MPGPRRFIERRALAVGVMLLVRTPIVLGLGGGARRMGRFKIGHIISYCEIPKLCPGFCGDNQNCWPCVSFIFRSILCV